MEIAVCSKCGKGKPLTEFYLIGGTRKKLRADCKECISLKNKRYYAETADKFREHRAKFRANNRQLVNGYARKSYWKIRKEIIQAYGSECACCSEAEPLFLELDHIANDGWKRKDKGSQTLYRQVKREGFPKDKYQLLCANCNQGKRRNKGICPHQQR